MTTLRTATASALVCCTVVAGTSGIELIFTALPDHVWSAVAWGLPLTLGGLYESRRALAPGQYGLRRGRMSGD